MTDIVDRCNNFSAFDLMIVEEQRMFAYFQQLDGNDKTFQIKIEEIF